MCVCVYFFSLCLSNTQLDYIIIKIIIIRWYWSFKLFKGNNEKDSIVYHEITPPIQACYIRLRPTAWYGHISLRMELYVCLGMVNTTLSY